MNDEQNTEMKIAKVSLSALDMVFKYLYEELDNRYACS